MQDLFSGYFQAFRLFPAPLEELLSKSVANWLT